MAGLPDQFTENSTTCHRLIQHET